MADTKITALTAITTVDPAVDVLPIVDVSDTSMAASGTTKKITSNQILGAGGTATLASATITGDLTVRTNKLKVTSIGVGAGTTTPAAILHSTQTSSYDALILDSDSASTYCTANWKVGGVQKAQAYLDFADDSLLIRTNTATGPLKFGCNNILQHRIDPLGVFTWYDGAGGTRMTLNSTGLGVGVVPAAAKIQAAASALAAVPAAGATGHILAVGSTPYGLAAGALTNGNSYIQATRWDGTATNYDLLIQPNGGNVGLGITPKPWRSGARALQLGANGYVTLHEQSNGNANLCFAAYEGSANVFNYTTTGDLPSRYVLVSGTHQWYTAPSGIAGNAITFTEVMRLDASGNLILLPSNTPPSLGTNGQLTVNATSNTNLRFSYRGSDGVTRVANLTLA